MKDRSKGVKINPRYDLRFAELMELVEQYKGQPFDLGVACFRIGYMQGTKAAKKKAPPYCTPGNTP